MSVDPGFYGQTFMPAALDRISRLSRKIGEDRNGRATLIQVDGGINMDNIGDVVRAGARVIVAGGAVFGAEDPDSACRNMKNRALMALQA